MQPLSGVRAIWCCCSTHPTQVNDMLARATKLHPDRFAALAGLPQVAGTSPANCVEELERCVKAVAAWGLLRSRVFVDFSRLKIIIGPVRQRQAGQRIGARPRNRT